MKALPDFFLPGTMQWLNRMQSRRYVGVVYTLLIEIMVQIPLKVFLELNVDVGVERLKIRNQCIPGYTKEEIFKRCDEVDRSNAELIQKSGRTCADAVWSLT